MPDRDPQSPGVSRYWRPEVTAPDPIRARLDELGALHANLAAPISGMPTLAQDREYPTDVNAVHRDGGSSTFAECYGEDSAALIVAAVNALPGLLAAVRAVADLPPNATVQVADLHRHIAAALADPATRDQEAGR
jgi:hypothetical protein